MQDHRCYLKEKAKSEGAELIHLDIFELKSGIFEKKYSKYLQNAFQIRNNCDYDDFYIVSAEDAKVQYENAKEMLIVIRKYLTNMNNM